MASYTVQFKYECSPHTHWGEVTDHEVLIYGEMDYVDGEDCFDSNGEKSTIRSWEDAVDDLTARWEGDSLSEYDYIDIAAENPFKNGKSEFEDGTGNVNLETIKVEIFDDDSWENLFETKNLS